jgi:DNA helicase-2/ATP-dependent DNA helicase PcrA
MFRPFSPLGVPTRSQVNRACDDLYRQYFVAFSRPQEVILLVGLDGVNPSAGIATVATGWDRTGNPRWAGNSPLLLI